jgi:hypothetical protein
MNKTIKVIEHLEKYKKITSLQAIEMYGATRLSAIIFNLRHKRNMNIRNERVNFVDRYGTKSHYDIYILED